MHNLYILTQLISQTLVFYIQIALKHPSRTTFSNFLYETRTVCLRREKNICTRCFFYILYECFSQKKNCAIHPSDRGVYIILVLSSYRRLHFPSFFTKSKHIRKSSKSLVIPRTFHLSPF